MGKLFIGVPSLRDFVKSAGLRKHSRELNKSGACGNSNLASEN
jgi:hypothetical protein